MNSDCVAILTSAKSIIVTDVLEVLQMRFSLFLIHGRDIECISEVINLLSVAGIDVFTFDDIQSSLQSGAPFIGQVVDVGLDKCDATLALFTPDELASLQLSFRKNEDGPSDQLRWQARPNVIFEAGLALAKHPKTTLLVTVGSDVRLFSDVEGRLVRRLDDGEETKRELLGALTQLGAELDKHAIDRAVALESPAITRVVAQAANNAADPFGHLGGQNWAIASTLVVVDDDNRFLLVRHPFHGTLLPPGGRVRNGEKPDEFGVAETLEETGYKVTFHPKVHPELELPGERGITVSPRPFHVQCESGQRGGLEHYDMIYVACPSEKISEGRLDHGWYELRNLEALKAKEIWPNVINTLRSVYEFLSN